MIALENIEITFNKGTPLEMRALRGIDLAIPNGQFLTVIGSNGAGKSTLLNILAGEMMPDKGRLMVDGVDITRAPVYRRSSVIARLFQDPRAGICEGLSIIENIAIASARTAPRRFGFAITRAMREEAAGRLETLGLGLEKRLNDRVALLSGGQRQALSLIMATFGPAKILLLDEHTAALDPGAAGLVMKLTREVVRRHEITTMMVTHSMRQALDYGDRIVMLHQGRIARDISGAARAATKMDDLLRLFGARDGEEVAGNHLLPD
jgi:putative tryptophan/tyrosine transport system ATP-binding protein